ncbi:MAG: SMC family ATPase [Pseudomonadota bacterium]
MRPVRLTLQAFGPYASREVIDFRRAVDVGLFGIYGRTGSGKSTIFSGMTFALFGEASKAEQDRASLRSDHAAATLITEVEFVFDVGERRFVVVRQPDQMRPKQRGEGETRSQHEAFLFDATGLSTDDITADRRGKILAEKKVRDVDAAIVEILGYGADQFRQIVLLPQGRFEKFLSAKTIERQSILRELFDVSVYQSLMADLKEQASKAEQHVRDIRTACAGLLDAEGFESVDALLAGIEAADQDLTTHASAEADARSKAEAAEEGRRRAEALETRFVAAEKAQAELGALMSQKADVAALADQVKKAERARLLLDVEEQAIAAKQNAIDAEKRVAEATAAQAQAKQKADAAANAQKKEEARSPEVDAARKRRDDLERYAERLRAASQSADAVEIALAAERVAKSEFEKCKLQLEQLRDTRIKRTGALKTARATEAERGELIKAHAEFLAQKATAQTYEKARADVTSAQEAFRQQSDASDELSKAEDRARTALEAAETALAAAHAVRLAATLEDDAPCPVCGSIDHPEPATGEIGNASLDRAFRDARGGLQEAEQTARKAGAKLAGLEAALAERKERLASLDRPAETVAAIVEKVRQIDASLETLGPATDINQEEAGIESLDRRIARLEQETERLRGALDQRRNAAIEARTTRDGKLADIPEALRTDDALASALNDASRTLEGLITAKERAQKLARSTRDNAISAEENLKGAKRSLIESQTRLETAAGTFRKRLAETELTNEVYQSLKAAIATIQSDSASVKEFERRLNEAQGAASAARAAIKDLTRPDLQSATEAHEEAKKSLANATEAKTTADNRVKQLMKLREKLQAEMRKLDETEAASGPLRKVAALANGENPFKLKLEIYAIGAMFDRVLEAANLRLGPMTSSRYKLERDAESGRGSRGLGIRVFDVHTGKSRATDTLSGGETFIAALSLALGLADIVEAANGKVRLDTIFIDEGFGSLDTEDGSGTLDQVLQVLNSLVRQSRAVGLISHVPLVQEAIPNGFYVRKGLTGSTVEEKGAV